MKMDQHHHHIHTQQIQTKHSIIQTHFASKRDASFSSYLQPNHIENQTKTPLQKNTAEDSSDQISIFDAAKYFGTLNDHDSLTSPRQNTSRLSSVSVSSIVETETSSIYRAKSFHATPTASSEASWNSRSGLLGNNPTAVGSLAISVSNFSPISCSNDRLHGVADKNVTKWQKIMNPKWLIPPRKCPCSGKKSVQVEERISGKSKTPARMVDLRKSPSCSSSSFYSTRQNSPVISYDSRNRNLGNNVMISSKSNSLRLIVSDHKETTSISGTSNHGFTFPILEGQQPVAVKKMFNVIAPDPSRDSVEVYQPRTSSHMIPKSRRVSFDDDNVSDGSSDLFEIESFSNTTYPCRNSIDEHEVIVSANNVNVGDNDREKFGIIMIPPIRDDSEEGITPSECYAPSEVSVDWSVTTDEGFDRGSLTNLSVLGLEIGMGGLRRETEKNGGGRGTGGRKNGGGNLLMSCRCEKAVNVGPGPIKCLGDGGPGTAVRHVGGRPPLTQQQGQLGATAKVGFVLGRPRSSLVPMPFAS